MIPNLFSFMSFSPRKTISDRWMTYRRNKTARMILRAKRDLFLTPEMLGDSKRTMYVCTAIERAHNSWYDFGSFNVDHLKQIIGRKIHGRVSLAIVFYEIVKSATSEANESFEDEFDICEGYTYYRDIYDKYYAQSAYVQYIRSELIDDLLHEILLGYCDPVQFSYSRVLKFDFQKFLKPEYRFQEF